jgi:hypothetical protein
MVTGSPLFFFFSADVHSLFGPRTAPDPVAENNKYKSYQQKTFTIVKPGYSHQSLPVKRESKSRNFTPAGDNFGNVQRLLNGRIIRAGPNNCCRGIPIPEKTGLP